MNFYEVVNARYSVRQYQDRPVPEEKLHRILEAVRVAPSACNKQPWHFFVVRDPQIRHLLFADREWAERAPVAVVACSIPEQAWVRACDDKCHADVDLGIAMEHLVLAATAEELGTCWICAFDPARFRSALQLPDNMEPVAATPLGYADVAQGPRRRKPMDEIVTWR